MTSPENLEPDYGFEKGLNVRVLDHTNGGEHSLHVDHATLKALMDSETDESSEERLQEQLLKPQVGYGEHAMGRTAVEFCVVGPEDASDVMYALYGWGGDLRHDVAINELKKLSKRFKDKQIVVVNTPGTGRSELLSRSLSKQISKEGDYSGYGELVAGATRSIVDGKNVHIRGHSLGARTAIAATPYIEGGVDSLIINDPTGARRMNLGQLAWRYVVKENMHLRQYIRHAFDPEAARLQGRPISAAMKKTLDGAKGSKRHLVLVDPKGLRHETLEESLYDAAPNVRNVLRVVVPEMSELSDWRDIDRIIARVRGYADVDADTSVETWVLKGHTHSWMTAAPSIEALLYDEKIQAS